MSGTSGKGVLAGVLATGFLLTLPFWISSTPEEKQHLTETSTTIPAVEKPTETALLELQPEEQVQLRTMLREKPKEEIGTDFERIVWMADIRQVIRRWVSSDTEADAIARWVYIYSVRFDLSPELVLGVIAVESRFDHFAISSVGARGLMQIMPFWKNNLGSSKDNLFDIQTNIRYGCAILRHYIDRYKRVDRALAAYNGSLGKMKYPNKVFTQMKTFKATREDSINPS